MKKGLFVFLFLIAVSAACIFITQSTPVVAHATATFEEEEDPIGNDGLAPDYVEKGLFNGAFAEWASDGSAESRNGENPLTTLIIHGGEKVNFTAQVEFRARFGPFTPEIEPFTVTVLAGENVSIPLNTNFAYSLHAKQAHYPTILYASVVIVLEDGTLGRRQILPHRFLTFNEENGKAEVYDAEALRSAFPRGITSQEERTKVEAVLSKMEGEGIDLGVQPGIPRTEPLSAAERIPGEDE